ncbi:MAG TPA: hypothetical protein VNH46_03595, partial [Gemmatimonadales bacterium]|nr:hypothetical protein [Gemmatimonadales bacterium]
QVLGLLEGEHRMVPGTPAPTDPSQLGLFAEPARPHPVMQELQALDLDRMTPLEALTRLAELQRRSTSP